MVIYILWRGSKNQLSGLSNFRNGGVTYWNGEVWGRIWWGVEIKSSIFEHTKFDITIKWLMLIRCDLCTSNVVHGRERQWAPTGRVPLTPSSWFRNGHAALPRSIKIFPEAFIGIIRADTLFAYGLLAVRCFRPFWLPHGKILPRNNDMSWFYYIYGRKNNEER